MSDLVTSIYPVASAPVVIVPVPGPAADLGPLTARVDAHDDVIGDLYALGDATPIFTALADLYNRAPSSLLTDKGDLLGATAANTPARVPVGLAGYLLTADPDAATGVSWQPAATTAIAEPSSDDLTAINTLATWIGTAVVSRGGDPQGKNGWISMHPPGTSQTNLRPYQANLGARGLARATQVTGNFAYVDIAWTHLTRYAASMDANGYVYDYSYAAGAWSPARYDSTDAYAGTFLSALWACYLADPDPTRLATYASAIDLAYTAMVSTQNAVTGLTNSIPAAVAIAPSRVYALNERVLLGGTYYKCILAFTTSGSPTAPNVDTTHWVADGTSANYAAALLEDNAETFDGMVCGAKLANALNDPDLAASFLTKALLIRHNTHALTYDPANGWYAAPGRNQAGAYATSASTLISPSGPNDSVASLSSLASAAMPQAWAVRYGIAAPGIAAELMDKVHTAQPTWFAADNYDAAPIAIAHMVAGNYARGYVQARALYERALTSGFAWPFTPMAAGQLIEAFSGVADIYPEPPSLWDWLQTSSSVTAAAVTYDGSAGVLLTAAGDVATALNTLDYETFARVEKSTLNANTVLVAHVDDVPAALSVAASRFVGRKSTGVIAAMTPAEAKTELAIAHTDVSGLGNVATRAVGTTAGTAAAGDDARFTDTRTPTDASVTDAKIATTLSPTKITGTAVVTVDARLSDARVPTTHATSHQPGGADAISTAVAGASAPADTASAGAATSLARSDHRHSREAFGSPAASAVADAATDGVATTLARSDHKHAREAFATTPSTQAFGDAAAAGVATTLARGDHLHAMPATPITASADKGNLYSVSPVDAKPYAASGYGPLVSGKYASNIGTPSADVDLHVPYGDGTIWYVPYLALTPSAATRYIDLYSVLVSVATGSPKILFGLYTDDGSNGTDYGVPSSLVTNSSVLSATLSVTGSPSGTVKSSGSRPALAHATWYWLAMCVQGGSALSVRAITPAPISNIFSSSTLMSRSLGALVDNSQYPTGGLPATATSSNLANSASPLIRFRNNSAS